MQLRHFGKLGVKPSLIGFGAMRLPIVDGDNNKINEEKSIEMIRYAIDNGVNYVDTAFNYHGGNSEELVAKALADGYREKVFLATKNPSWLSEKPGDWTDNLDIQLKRLDCGHIDFYLQHALDKARFDNLVKNNFFEEAMKAKAEGKIKYFGFSFHDSYEVFEEIINAYDWDFCQIQLNYLDEDYQAGMKGLKLAASKNMGVIIMEPLRGGKLADKMPEDIVSEFEKLPVKRSNVEWALRWVANHPEVSLLLSGMHTMEQVKENIRICSQEDMVPDKALTNEEQEMIKSIADAWNKRILVNCTACNYCMPCPVGVQIPDCFSAYNVYGSAVASAESKAKQQYASIVENGGGASQCIVCGQCAAACPQNISVPDRLAELEGILR
jgi:hypothetical protein